MIMMRLGTVKSKNSIIILLTTMMKTNVRMTSKTTTSGNSTEYKSLKAVSVNDQFPGG